MFINSANDNLKSKQLLWQGNIPELFIRKEPPLREPSSLLPASWPRTAHRTSSASRGWGLLAGALRQHRQGVAVPQSKVWPRTSDQTSTKPQSVKGSVLTLPLKEGEGSCAAEQLPTLPKHLPQHPPPSGTLPISLLGSQSYSRAGPRSARCDRHFKACTGTYF